MIQLWLPLYAGKEEQSEASKTGENKGREHRRSA